MTESSDLSRPSLLDRGQESSPYPLPRLSHVYFCKLFLIQSDGEHGSGWGDPHQVHNSTIQGLHNVNCNSFDRVFKLIDN